MLPRASPKRAICCAVIRSVLFCSPHTTAGYLDRSLAVRMHNRYDLLSQFFRAFRALFPQGAEYSHDQMDLRTELSDAQKIIEPRNGDSHLTFIGARMRNCVTLRTNPSAPVYFIDLDGTTEAFRRERKTTILGFDRERPVAQMSIACPYPNIRSIPSIWPIRGSACSNPWTTSFGGWGWSMRGWI